MPEQGSKRGDSVTKAPFEGPFETLMLRWGIRGLNLKDALDAVAPDQYSRFTNADHDSGGEVTTRPGQTSLATGGTRHHSMRKLRDPQNSNFTRLWGVDTDLYRNASGALTLVEANFSGNPLALLPHRPPLSGDPWMFVGDTAKMRKVRVDGLSLPIGVVAPTVAAAPTVSTEFRKAIVNFDASDATNAASWTGAPGNDNTGAATDVPTALDDGSPAGPAVGFTTVPGSITGTSYDSWWGIAVTRDCNTLKRTTDAVTTAASDQDVMHLWMKTANPLTIVEVRLYIVVSGVFNPLELPGRDRTLSGANTDAYVKSFRQNDFIQFIQANQSQIDAAETARIYALRDTDLADRAIVDDRASWAISRAQDDPGRDRSEQIGTGAQQWFELGTIGVSLRRGDFKRIGTDTTRDWSTVTGVIVYVRVAGTGQNSVAVDDLYLTGGFGPDTVEPGAQQLDYRYTNYDPRTGAESNMSPVMADGAFLDSIRRRIDVVPAGHADGNMRQRFYRRGGANIENWYFLGQNGSNGGFFVDELSDDATIAAGVGPIDHYQAVPTVDDNGNTILAQPVHAIWGPVEGMLLACGDPYRPGHLYFSTPDEPDHWASDGNVEVCAPSEQLMNGGLMGHQAFVFSRERLYMLYPNLTGSAGIAATPTEVKRGLAGRWAFATGPGGIYYLAEDGIFNTQGGPEEWISRDVDPLFKGKSKNGYLPVSFTAERVLRMTVWESKLYFGYQDTGGSRQVLVYDILQKFWKHITFGKQSEGFQGDDEDTLIIGGAGSGKSYTHEGFSDDGAAITCTARSGVIDANLREEKLLGDQIVDCDRQGVDILVTNYVNEEASADPTMSINAGTGRQRYILDAFGDTPQRARSISTELFWSHGSAAPIIYRVGFATTLQPDVTQNRVTNWDDMGSGDESYVTGVTFDCHTGGVDRTIIIERDFGGVTSIVTTLTVNADGRHKLKFSWPAVQAHKIRVRPNDDCKFWLLYKCDWIFQNEPPRIARWDIHFENQWDQYYTGLDLYCDTEGLEKRVEVYVDQNRLSDPATGLTYFPIVANGRKVVHLTLPWGRGHVFRFVAIDDNPGLLYSHRWFTDPEPSEQANWNQNFSIYGTRADKYLKAIVFECDTFGANKSVTVEVDGVVVETLTVNANGRRVVQLALANQQLGRVWRMFPIDSNPGRLYTAQPVFDEEPLKLNRWETQETNHGLPGWFQVLWAHVTLKCTADVTLTLTLVANQELGTRVTKTYTISHTSGAKVRRFVSFEAGKGVLAKYLLTSASPFWLYREETVVQVQPWGAAELLPVQPFGDDDLDPTRPMKSASLAAAAPGGSLGDQ
jgi:hypothetical protein